MGLEEMGDLLKDQMEKLDTPNKEEIPTKSFNHRIQGSGETFLVKSLHLYNAASRISSWLGWARVPETNI